MTGVILSDLTDTVCLSNLLIMIRHFEKSLEWQLLVHPKKMEKEKKTLKFLWMNSVQNIISQMNCIVNSKPRPIVIFEEKRGGCSVDPCDI